MRHKRAKRIFFNWLKKKGIYKHYKYYRHQANNAPDAGYHRSYLCDPERYVVDAFTWADTIQGRPFWKNLNDEWVNYLQILECRYH